MPHPLTDQPIVLPKAYGSATPCSLDGPEREDISREQPETLLDMPAGQRLLVRGLNASAPERAKLCALGIFPGAEMEVCQSSCGKGGVRVRVRRSSLFLSEEMARSVHCGPAGQFAHRGCHGKHSHHGHGPHKGCCGRHHGTFLQESPETPGPDSAPPESGQYRVTANLFEEA